MAKTHTLNAETGEGVTERKVDGQERLIIRTGSDLASWKVSELRRVEVERSYNDEHAIVMVDTMTRGGTYTPLVRGATLELGEDRWPVADLVSFVLTEIPKPAELEPAPEPVSRTWLLKRMDGSEELVTVLGAGEVRGSLDPSVPLADSGWGVDLEHVLSFERIEEQVTVQMTIGLAIIAALVCGCLGALGGRALVRREIGPIIATARASAGRANAASAVAEAIAVEWPALLARVDEIESQTRAGAFNAQEAKRKAGDAVARQEALEKAVAGALNVSLTTGGR